MAGNQARAERVRASWKAPGAAVATAAVLFVATMIALASGWIRAGPAVVPPLWFLAALAAVLGATGAVYAGLRSRASARVPITAPARAPSRPPPNRPARARPAPPPPARVADDVDAFLAELDAEDVAPIVLPPVAEGEGQPCDIAMLNQWLDGICDQVSEWAAIAASLDEPPKTVEPETGVEKEEAEYTETWNPVLVPSLEDARAAEARGGAWTEAKARSAVERYLRLKPWAPVSHVAEALDMDLPLATRVVQSLRRDRVV